MDKNHTITIQEVRRDPVAFLQQLNRGKVITVIYRSKPFSVVRSAKDQSFNDATNVKRMLQYAELVRKSVKNPLEPAIDYKATYQHDMAQKYDVS